MGARRSVGSCSSCHDDDDGDDHGDDDGRGVDDDWLVACLSFESWQ